METWKDAMEQRERKATLFVALVDQNHRLFVDWHTIAASAAECERRVRYSPGRSYLPSQVRRYVKVAAYINVEAGTLI
jgi:hypothetical protein